MAYNQFKLHKSNMTSSNENIDMHYPNIENLDDPTIDVTDNFNTKSAHSPQDLEHPWNQP